MDIAILFGLLFVLLALSVPIGISLGIATAVTILTCSHLPLEGLGDMGLPHHIVKGSGPPFAV